MKRFFLFALVAMMFAACSTDATQDLAPETPASSDELYASFEEDTRIQLQNGKTVWNAGDLVSVFYKSNANQQWQFQGKTGDRSGILRRVNTAVYTATMDRVVVVYPYSENYLLNLTTGDIEAILPAIQTYRDDSYGADGNIMVSSSYFTQVTLKNVCGWLKLQFTGNQTVQSILLAGNKGEQVAGLIYINTEDATSILASEMGDIAEDEGENATGGVGGTLVFDDTILTEVMLNCGDGVALDKNIPTAFYIALPPQIFDNGVSVAVTCADGSVVTKSTAGSLDIKRNHIVPMDVLVLETDNPTSQPSNEIWYTSYNEKVVEPSSTNGFGANIVSNTYTNGRGVIAFDNDVTKIGYQAFYNCKDLTSVSIPENVTLIDAYAFQYCTSLESVTMGKRVAKIGNYAFDGCSMLHDLTIGSGVTEIGSSAFADCVQLPSVTIPDSVITIGGSAFSDCTKVTKVTIGSDVTTIGDGAFEGCTKLTDLTIGNSVTEIGYQAFSYCSALPSVTIPDSVTLIDAYAFQYCTSLESVTMGKRVAKIGNYAFDGCSMLKKVFCKPVIVPTGGSNMFNGNTSDRKIYVPTASVDEYKITQYWSDYASAIEPYNFTE